MAGRKRNLTLDEKIQKTKEEIEEAYAYLTELKNTYAQLEEQKEQAAVQKLLDLMKSSDKSFEDVASYITQ